MTRPAYDPDYGIRPLDTVLAVGLVVLSLVLWYVLWEQSR